MAVVYTELKLYRSAVVNDTASNGGILSVDQEPSYLTDSWFSAADPADATAGKTQYRKAFVKVDNAEDLPLNNARIGLNGVAPGDLKSFLIAGTQTDIQSGVGATLYGGGPLNANVSAGASSITVLVEDGDDIVFRDGDEIVITDKATALGAGNREFHTISGTPGVAGDVVTIMLSGTLANGYSASNTRVSSLLPLGTLQASVGTPAVTSLAGTFDEGEMTAHNIGGLYQTFTFTFTSATAFTCVGDTLGSVGSGNIGSIFAPNNPAFGSPYCTVLPAAWGGTFQAGDTVAVLCQPAAGPFWEKRVLPAGASDIQGHNRYLMIFGNG